MEALNISNKSIKQLGFHYYADTAHYDEASLEFWLPKLKAIGARWLVLTVPVDYELPQDFVKALITAKIEPVISLCDHISTPLDELVFRQKMTYYHEIGIHLVKFFNHPNMKSSWNEEEWQKPDLVSRFMKLYDKYAEICIDEKIIPLFPLLEPGGDYWDLSFLKESVHYLKEFHSEDILPNIIFTANAGLQEHDIEWGCGGPSLYPRIIAYESDQVDHRGFHIYEWYTAIIKAEIGQNVPMVLFQAGQWASDMELFTATPESGKKDYLKILQALQKFQFNEDDKIVTDVPSYVISCNLYRLPTERLLNSEDDSLKGRKNTLYKKISEKKSASGEIMAFLVGISVKLIPWLITNLVPFLKKFGENYLLIVRKLFEIIRNGGKVSDYFLIPETSQLFTEDQYAVIQQFVNQHHCKSGRNLKEALASKNVIIVNDSSLYPSFVLKQLTENNCVIQTVALQNQNI